MILFKKADALHTYLARKKKDQQKIGFVPTMGALHEGHLSLLSQSTHSNDCTVCSIFVNPTQFNDPEDFKKYPITLETDISLLEQHNTDVLFLPEVQEIYPAGLSGLQHYDLGNIEHKWEGYYRPGHFQGVCQVMHRLLAIVKPDNLYMGQKDYQQCMVVKKLQMLIHCGTVLHSCPTLRELDGLALSSRNRRLNPVERREAPAIFQALLRIKNDLHAGPVDGLIAAAKSFLEQHHFKVDYVTIADAATLDEVGLWDATKPLIALVAAYLNEVRLIDNMMLTADSNELPGVNP